MTSGRANSFSTQIFQTIDGALIWAAFWLAALLRQPVREILRQVQLEDRGLADLTALIVIIVILGPVALGTFGFYRDSLYRKPLRSLWQIFRAGMVVVLVVGIVVIFLKVPVDSRWTLGGAALISTFLLLARVAVTQKVVRQMLRAEDTKEPVLLVGSVEARAGFLAEMPERFFDRMKVVAELDPVEGEDLQGLEDVIKREAVGKVLFAGRGTAFDVLSKNVELCEVLGVEAWIMADFMQTRISRPTFDTLGGKGMLVLKSTPELSWALLAKNAIDRVGALVLLVLTAPLWLVAALGIHLSSTRGPVLFLQSRAGRYGKPFKVWKFRTMNLGAEKELEELKKTMGNQMDGPVFKLDKDPRVFAWGSFLRKTSIDELPQLVNVVRGEMSLVGPRPLPLYEVELFDKSAYRRRLSVKPGITCTWQAGGRNSITSFEEWVKLDLEYIDNWSLWLDAKILLKTVPAVLMGRGAR